MDSPLTICSSVQVGWSPPSNATLGGVVPSIAGWSPPPPAPLRVMPHLGLLNQQRGPHTQSAHVPCRAQGEGSLASRGHELSPPARRQALAGRCPLGPVFKGPGPRDLFQCQTFDEMRKVWDSAGRVQSQVDKHLRCLELSNPSQRHREHLSIFAASRVTHSTLLLLSPRERRPPRLLQGLSVLARAAHGHAGDLEDLPHGRGSVPTP